MNRMAAGRFVERKGTHLVAVLGLEVFVLRREGQTPAQPVDNRGFEDSRAKEQRIARPVHNVFQDILDDALPGWVVVLLPRSPDEPILDRWTRHERTRRSIEDPARP